MREWEDYDQKQAKKSDQLIITGFGFDEKKQYSEIIGMKAIPLPFMSNYSLIVDEIMKLLMIRRSNNQTSNQSSDTVPIDVFPTTDLSTLMNGRTQKIFQYI